MILYYVKFKDEKVITSDNPFEESNQDIDKIGSFANVNFLYLTLVLYISIQ